MKPNIAIVAHETSVTISLTHSLPVDHYGVSLTLVTGSDQALCSSVVDNKAAVTITGNSTTFSDLEEFSTYNITVDATFNTGFGLISTSGSTVFTTISDGMLL